VNLFVKDAGGEGIDARLDRDFVERAESTGCGIVNEKRSGKDTRLKSHRVDPRH
jgi:hypothetical protein